MGRRLRCRSDAGLTLAELGVTMAIFGIFTLFSMTAFVQATRLFRENTNRDRSAQQASLVMAQVSKDVRTAVLNGPVGSQVAFTQATGSAVTFYSGATSSSAPVRERLWVDSSGGLWKETTDADTTSVPPDYTYAAAVNQVSRRITGRLLGTSSLFTYVLSTGTEMQTVPAADLSRIAGVRIRVTLNADTSGRVADTVLENTVRPYNLPRASPS